MAIIVYNIRTEEPIEPCSVFYIGRGSVLGNPYTHLPVDKTLAIHQVATREESIELYDAYFDKMYAEDEKYRKAIDEIYEKYKSGETVYLGCYCKPLPCHGDIIKKKLEQRLIREKINKIKKRLD